MRKFCFLCGKDTDKLIEGYCEECYSEKHKIAVVPEKTEIIVCPKCNKAKVKMDWKELDIKKILEPKIKAKGKIKSVSVSKTEKAYEVIVKGYLPKSRKLKTETHPINIHLDKRICEFCAKRLSNYYTAILQIRFRSFEARANKKRILRIICGELERTGRKDPMAFYRIEQKRKDFDFYIGSKSAANKIAQLLKNKYKAETKMSFELVTKKEGKDIYRNITLVRV